MNECYIEINQDFTKVKTTQTLSWYLDLCMIAIFCNVLMDASINIYYPSLILSNTWQQTIVRVHALHFKFLISQSLSISKINDKFWFVILEKHE